MLSPENRHGNGESLVLDTRYIFIHGRFSIVMLVFMGLVYFPWVLFFPLGGMHFFWGGKKVREHADMKTSRFAADG